MSVTKLPTAATSYIILRKTKSGVDVVLATPAGTKTIRTALCRCPDRRSAIEQGQKIAADMKRPFMVRGGA